MREYLDRLKPVVITGALEHWPARSKWTFDFFRDHYGDLPLEVDGRQLSMAQLIAEVRASTPHAPAPYLHNFEVKQLPEALQADIAPIMNLVVAAALILDGLPFDMRVDAPGFLTKVAQTGL